MQHFDSERSYAWRVVALVAAVAVLAVAFLLYEPPGVSTPLKPAGPPAAPDASREEPDTPIPTGQAIAVDSEIRAFLSPGLDSFLPGVPQPPNGSAPTSTEPALPFSLSGVVVDHDGNAVPLAQVHMNVTAAPTPGNDAPQTGDPGAPSAGPRDEGAASTSEYVVSADGAGQFAFRNVPFAQAAMNLHAAKDGFIGISQRVTPKSGAETRQIVLRMEPGRTIVGTLIAPDGRGVADGVVSCHQAWNQQGTTTTGDDARTNARGGFALVVSADAEAMDVRAVSPQDGQDFFLDVAIDDKPLVLRMKAKASLHGLVSHPSGRPAAGTVVVAETTLPFRESQFSFGFEIQIPRIRAHDRVDAEGRYRIDGLYPGLTYGVRVFDQGEQTPLSPDTWITLTAGEDREWNYRQAAAFEVHGRVLTAGSGRTVRAAKVHVEKDGRPLVDDDSDTGDTGEFFYRTANGPGRYTFYAVPKGASSSFAAELRRRFANVVDLREQNAPVEVDLKLPEPAIFRVQVVDRDGGTPMFYAARLIVSTPSGKEQVWPASDKGDGHATFMAFEPNVEAWVTVGWSKGGAAEPGTEGTHRTVRTGVVYPEDVVVLEPSCGVSGRVLTADGAPAVTVTLRVDAKYDNGSVGGVTVQTDADGSFSEKLCLLARPMDLTITAESESGRWELGHILPDAYGLFNCGTLVLPPPRRACGSLKHHWQVHFNVSSREGNSKTTRSQATVEAVLSASVAIEAADRYPVV